jgi:hypothetical protein
MKECAIIFIIILLVSITPVFAETQSCTLSASLVNQDPYPAIPGESVKLVFQIDGVSNPSCGKVEFTLIESYPIKIEEGTSATTSINSGVFVRNYGDFFLAPYTVIIDKNALDGQSQIEAFLNSDTSSNQIVDFEINIEDSRADFEVSIQDYVLSEKELTFEILNIAESDVESLTIEIKKQENILLKGSNRNIIGSLDSNEDTTFSFEATPKEGDIILDIYYTDKTGVRRNLEKTVNYDPTYFADRARDQNGANTFIYWIIGSIILITLFWWWGRKNKHAGYHKNPTTNRKRR